MTRAERHTQVVALKASGLTFLAIAVHLGLAKSTVTSAYYDPTGAKDYKRRHRNDGECVDCGTATHNGGEAIPPARCANCHVAHSRTLEQRRSQSVKHPQWTHDQCIEAMRAVAVDGVCTTTMYLDAYEPGRVPSRSTLIVRFGSWRDAVHAAGLRVGHETQRAEYANRTSDADLLCAIRDCAAYVGHWPGAGDYDRWASGRGPVRMVLTQRFGSWMRALELAMKSDSDLRDAA